MSVIKTGGVCWSMFLFIYLFIYTKILEVNLFAFAYRHIHRDFSPVNGAFCIGTHSLFIYINIVSSWFIHYIFVGEGGSITTKMVKCTHSHSLIVLQVKKYLDLSNSVNKCC